MCLSVATIMTLCAMCTTSSAAPPARRTVAILIFDDVQIIDFTAPYEVFGGPFNVYTVAKSKDPITTTFGMQVIPQYDFKDAPRAQILVLPGGGKHYPDNTGPYAHGLPFSDHPGTIEWVRAAAGHAEIVMSVCNGAFTLGRAGLLEGLEATTTASLQALLQEASPGTRVRDDRRFVDNGKIITAAGLTSGIDASLHVMERLLGRGTAQQAALGLEYNWDPTGSWSRAALADRYMRFNFQGFEETEWTSVSRQGDTAGWESRWSVKSDASPADLLRVFDTTLEQNRTYRPTPVKWTRSGSRTAGSTESLWSFTDEQGRPWQGRSAIEPAAGEKGRYIFSLRVSLRQGAATAAR